MTSSTSNLTVKQEDHDEGGAPEPFATGVLVGVLIGEGHFGGDGKQPHVTLRMHTDHENLFLWIVDRFPGGRLYGPYDHSGRRYYQWMARGQFLRGTLVPILDRHLTPELDGRAYARYQAMKARYKLDDRSGTAAGGMVHPTA